MDAGNHQLLVWQTLQHIRLFYIWPSKKSILLIQRKSQVLFFYHVLQSPRVSEFRSPRVPRPRVPTSPRPRVPTSPSPRVPKSHVPRSTSHVPVSLLVIAVAYCCFPLVIIDVGVVIGKVETDCNWCWCIFFSTLRRFLWKPVSSLFQSCIVCRLYSRTVTFGWNDQ